MYYVVRKLNKVWGEYKDHTVGLIFPKIDKVSMKLWEEFSEDNIANLKYLNTYYIILIVHHDIGGNIILVVTTSRVSFTIIIIILSRGNIHCLSYLVNMVSQKTFTKSFSAGITPIFYIIICFDEWAKISIV